MRYLAIIILFFQSLGAFSQVDLNTDSISISDEIMLPPIDTLYAWAIKNSPVVKQQDAMMEKTDADTRRVQKQWMNGIKFSANIRSGNYGNTVVNQVETGYSYGPVVSFSLYEVFSQRNLVNVYKAEEKVASYKRDEVIFELKKWISILYNNVVTQQNLLKIRNEAVSSAEIHLKMAEKEFNEGSIQLGELSRVSEIYTKTRADREVTLNDLKNYYMQLQQFCGIKF